MSIQSFHFSKMHGLGNDFVVIDTINQSVDWRQLPLQQIADRHLGIGCDQILIIERSSNADFYCRILNSDGSEAEQCGNGLRCIARFVHENSLHPGKQLSIETVAGVFPVEMTDYDHIRITIPVPEMKSLTISLQLSAHDTEVSGSALSIGNPHFIMQVADIHHIQTRQIGHAISTHPDFPNGTNVGFMQIINPNYIRLRTYERGAGETHACGSNACAAVVSGILSGTLLRSVTVEFKYGQLKIEWDGKEKPVHMNGPATLVFRGEITI